MANAATAVKANGYMPRLSKGNQGKYNGAKRDADSHLDPAEDSQARSNELAAANPGPPSHDSKGRFLPGNVVCKSKRARINKYGSLVSPQCPTKYRDLLKAGGDYSKHRRFELAKAHGGYISSAVGAMIEQAGKMLAAANYMTFISTTMKDPAEVAEYLGHASRLSKEARQAEALGWELAAREAKVAQSMQRADATQGLLEALNPVSEDGVADPATLLPGQAKESLDLPSNPGITVPCDKANADPGRDTGAN